MSALSKNRILILLIAQCIKCRKVVRNGILCDLCDKWNHFRCVGVDENDLPDVNTEWKCPSCDSGPEKVSFDVTVEGEESESNIQTLKQVIHLLNLDLDTERGKLKVKMLPY